MLKFLIVFLLTVVPALAQTTNLRTRSLNNVRFCDQFAGATAGARIVACLTDIPSTGGVADSRSLQGALTFTSCPFTGVTKEITVVFSSATFTLSANCTIPANITLSMDQGAIISVNAGSTLTVSGTIVASLTKHFAGAGAFNLAAAQIGFISPEWWGAINDGATDSTAASQSALDAAGVASIVCFGHGTFKWTSTVQMSNDQVQLCGRGKRSTKILFAPTANDTALYVKHTGAAIMVSPSIRSLSIYSDDNTWVKVGIDAVDTSDMLIDDVEVGGSVVHGGSRYMSDPTNASIALRTNGREAMAVRKAFLYADKPIVFATNPNSGISVDHFHFQDLYLAGQANALITIMDGVNLTNCIFDGDQTWVGGTDGLVWIDTTTVGQSESLRLENVRWEQGTSTTGHVVDIEHNIRLTSLIIQDMHWGSGAVATQNGIKLRKVNWTTLKNVRFDNTGAMIDMDSTSASLAMDNIEVVQAASTVAITTVGGINGCYYHEGVGKMYCFSPNTPNLAGTVTQRFNASTTQAFNQFEPLIITVAANTVIKLASNELKGILIISTGTTTVGAMYTVNGTANTTAIMAVSAALWWGAAAAAANFNIYSAGGEYKLQNNTGASETFTVLFTGVGEH